MSLELLDRPERATALHTPATVDPPSKPLGALASLAAIRRNFLEALDAELFRVPHRQARFLGQEFLAVCDPELMKAVLLDHADAFGRSENQQRVFRPALGEGLLVVEGARWRQQRRAASPAFRHEALLRMTPAFAAVAESTAARLALLGAEGPVDVDAEMTRATLEVVTRTLLAGDDAMDREFLARTLREYGDAMASPDWFDLLGAPGWVPRPWRARHRRGIAAMRGVARDALERRRARGELESGDLLGFLLAARDPESGRGLSEEELVDNILTFIAAGHETTAVLLTWTLGLIARAPTVQARLLAEARALGDGPVTADALERLPFHEQVLNEALRLFTPGPVLTRTAVRDVDLGPVRVRKGTQVFLHLYVLHRSERLWDRPAAFDPDRFSPERSAGRHRFAFLPFGGGPRVCIGARFAVMEAKVFLATLVRALALNPGAAAEPLPRMRLTVRPVGGMPLAIRPR